MEDHCTGWFEGWWSACCKVHDDDYLAQLMRLLADERLMDCVALSLPEFAMNHPILAAIFGVVSLVVARVMFVGVRVFGGYFYNKAGKQSGQS